MISFASDYINGAHPEVLRALTATNDDTTTGYGTDQYCSAAADKIRAACECPEADVFFLVGGTQTNSVVISSLLQEYEGVIAAETGHIEVHEAGAVEATGHKVITLPQHDGKLCSDELAAYLQGFFADPSYEHMVIPGMVYISHPTEKGSLYSKDELTALSEVCSRYGLPLFMDGARLTYGLESRDTDLTLPDIAHLCDVFYIGGTKCGALCGEAVVFSGCRIPVHFLTIAKRHGALLAKGRLLGVQFDALFTDGLYTRIGEYAISMADRLKEIFAKHGCTFAWDSPTNQQFIVLEDSKIDKLREQFIFEDWERTDPEHRIVRFVTSWSTKQSDLEALDAALAQL